MTPITHLEALNDASTLVTALTAVNDRRRAEGLDPLDEGPALPAFEYRTF